MQKLQYFSAVFILFHCTCTDTSGYHQPTDVIHYLDTSVAYRRTHLLRRHCNCQ